MIHFRPDRLEKERVHNGWTQEEVALKIGVARSTYGNYEKGLREPDFRVMRALSDLFEVSIDYLTGKSNFRNENEIVKNRDSGGDYVQDGAALNTDPEIVELLEKLQQKGAELEATAILRTASKMKKEQLQDILKVFEMIEKDK